MGEKPVIMSILTASSWIRNWVKEEPSVSVDSLTEWLFYYVSRANSFTSTSGSGTGISFHFLPEDFLRRQDLWEWWLVVQDGPEKNAVKACRYFIRAAKLEESGNGAKSFTEYPETVREMIEYACRRGATPLYLFYTDCAAESEGKYNSFLGWEERRNNGCFLESALTVREKLTAYQPCPARELLKDACRLSILDRMERMTSDEQMHILDPDRTGECFFRGPLPDYVRDLIRDGEKRPERDRLPEDILPYVRGVGVLNLRRSV